MLNLAENFIVSLFAKYWPVFIKHIFFFSYFIIFFSWLICKLTTSQISFCLDFDYFFNCDGHLHDGWLIEYISTFNLVYLFYIISNCYYYIFHYYYYYFLMLFDVNYYSTITLKYEICLWTQWEKIVYESTFGFNLKLTMFFINFWNNPAIWYINPKDVINTINNVYKFFLETTEYSTIMSVCFLLFFLSSLISLFLLSYLGLYGVFILNLITLIIFWFSTIIHANYFFIGNGNSKLVIGKWFSIWGHTIIPFELFIDSISYSYVLLTLTIATSVYIYVFSYFRYEPNVERLLLFINFFVCSMILLVSSGNFFILFLGWELIGLTSFFLINFWSTRISTLKAAFKAYVLNKLSDVSLLIAVILSVLLVNDTNISVFNDQIHLYQNKIIEINSLKISYIEVLSFFFLLCAFIKSAQFGVHIWLPDSMEAPAPASALIHSATLVSAGIFLVLRFSPLFELSLYAYYIITLIGAFTAFFGGCCAVYQSDVKRILAYSTISHCGFLMLTCITRNPDLTIFYLYVHGFFKAAVFLCVGNLIRFSQNYQDFRKMGSFWKYLPFECICTLLCLFNLAGLPFTLGFFIKHILFACITNDSTIYLVISGFVIIASLAGIIYCYRLYYYIFYDLRKAKKYIYEHSNRNDQKSIFYTVTTTASNISILSLIVFGYMFLIYMYVTLFSKSNISESFDIVSILPSSYKNLNWPLETFLKFSSGFNWVVLQLITIIIISFWRKTYSFHTFLNSIFYLILFYIFFYTFFIILVYLV